MRLQFCDIRSKYYQCNNIMSELGQQYLTRNAQILNALFFDLRLVPHWGTINDSYGAFKRREVCHSVSIRDCKLQFKYLQANQKD